MRLSPRLGLARRILDQLWRFMQEKAAHFAQIGELSPKKPDEARQLTPYTGYFPGILCFSYLCSTSGCYSCWQAPLSTPLTPLTLFTIDSTFDFCAAVGTLPARVTTAFVNIYDIPGLSRSRTFHSFNDGWKSRTSTT